MALDLGLHKKRNSSTKAEKGWFKLKICVFNVKKNFFWNTISSQASIALAVKCARLRLSKECLHFWVAWAKMWWWSAITMMNMILFLCFSILWSIFKQMCSMLRNDVVHHGISTCSLLWNVRERECESRLHWNLVHSLFDWEKKPEFNALIFVSIFTASLKRTHRAIELSKNVFRSTFHIQCKEMSIFSGSFLLSLSIVSISITTIRLELISAYSLRIDKASR